jgi:hypothetical protein
MLGRIVVVAVAIIIGMPSVYYFSILGAHIGGKSAILTDGAIREDIGFVGGGVLGCAVAVFAAGFLAIGAARLTGPLLPSQR